MVEIHRLKYRSYMGEGYGEFVKKEDYLKVVEEMNYYKEKLSQTEQLNDFYKKTNKIDELELTTKIANDRYKEMKKMEVIINKLEDNNKYLNRENKELKISLNNSIKEICERNKELLKQDNQLKEREMSKMKEIKCCQGCQSRNKELIVKDGLFVKTVLEEDCEMTHIFNKEVEKDNFVDSWVLWYKVDGMDKAIQQFDLTKEECEIIYGNMNNITYWHMEVMK